MIIQSITKKLVERKIRKYPGMLQDLKNVQEEIKEEEMYAIMQKVNPEKTEIKVIKDADLFAREVTAVIYESIYSSLESNAEFEKIHGGNFCVGEIYRPLRGRERRTECSFDENKPYIILKTNKGREKTYEVLAYIPL